MTPSRTIEDSLAWLASGTALFFGALEDLDEGSVRAPSRLPGWSRAHVLAHVGYNAVALMNLVVWARSGVPTPMYSSASQRDHDIEDGATWPAPALREFVVSSASDLADGLASLDERSWATDVMTALGRTVSATEVPWMRAREVAVHAVDLGTGVSFRDVPTDFVSALVLDAADRRTTLGGGTPMRLVADEGGSWQIGTRAAAGLTVAGAGSELAAWITGRSEGTALRSSSGVVPQLSPWL